MIAAMFNGGITNLHKNIGVKLCSTQAAIFCLQPSQMKMQT